MKNGNKFKAELRKHVRNSAKVRRELDKHKQNHLTPSKGIELGSRAQETILGLHGTMFFRSDKSYIPWGASHRFLPT
jgi:hypothetical protein